MKYIHVYDVEADKIENLAEAEDTTAAEILEQIVEFAEDKGFFD